MNIFQKAKSFDQLEEKLKAAGLIIYDLLALKSEQLVAVVDSASGIKELTAALDEESTRATKAEEALAALQKEVADRKTAFAEAAKAAGVTVEADADGETIKAALDKAVASKVSATGHEPVELDEKENADNPLATAEDYTRAMEATDDAVEYNRLYKEAQKKGLF